MIAELQPQYVEAVRAVVRATAQEARWREQFQANFSALAARLNAQLVQEGSLDDAANECLTADGVIARIRALARERTERARLFAAAASLCSRAVAALEQEQDEQEAHGHAETRQ